MTDLATTQQQRQFKILLVGDNCKDIYQYGTIDRLSPEAPVPVFVPTRKEERDGMAGNVYNNLEALGCKVNYLFGETSTKTRLIDERSKQQIVRIDNDIESTPITFDTDIPEVYDAIVVSDYNKGTVSYELIEELVREVTVPIFVDTKKTDLARLAGCYIKINALEKSRATSLPDPKHLIVTHGGDGAVWDGWVYAAEIVGDVTDVCGAGDTFLAALTYKFLETNNMPDAVKFANKASSITVQHVGVYAPRLEEIE
jgi:D-beta-D-heptose 7-phosphate kinase/D-beta-D-heptose 1-phosphate adenosyltransferase